MWCSNLHIKALRLFTFAATAFALFTLSGCTPIVSEEASCILRSRIDTATFTWYPVHIVAGEHSTHDQGEALKIAHRLKESGFGIPVIADTFPEVPITWGHNEASMLRRSTVLFSEWVAAQNISTDYAILIEYLFTPDESKVLAVHYHIVTSRGEIAHVGMVNSHFDLFTQIDPETREDCREIAIKRIASDLIEPHNGSHNRMRMQGSEKR
jgi:hypothetical protein